MSVININGTVTTSISAVDGISTIIQINGIGVVLGAGTTTPTITSLSINVDGDELTVVFSEGVQAPVNGMINGLALHADAALYTFAGLTGPAIGTFIYSLNGLILAGQSVTLDYDAVAGDIQSMSGVPLAGFTAMVVTNNSTATSGTAPVDPATVSGYAYDYSAAYGVREAPADPAEHQDPVTGWDDISAASGTIISITTGNPIYNTSGADSFGGVPSLHFLRSSGQALETGPYWGGTRPLTIFSVFKLDSVNGSESKVILGSGAAGGIELVVGTNVLLVNKTNLVFIGNSSVGLAIGVTYIAAFTVSAAGVWKFWVNGFDGGSGTTDPGEFDNLPIAIGCGLAQVAPRDFFDGSIGRVILFNDVVSDANIAGITAFLADIYT